ncbi:DUF58 domain-containing protein [Allochromatium tepidum]|uniref:DUF58 domain-containing protein n=1 Tax=Allochromatium tepidum TaxID=553982 RepID=A0ABM7QP87_9GAMM|nr:DUF58 domain-containing protein [Allochromatium tepidum]BCU07506.1 hypothetical protein Atep_21830 [Allochromatium tepidum]
MADSNDRVQPGIRADLKELIALRTQARRLDLAPRGRVLATRSGGHLSRFRGRGMEFDESRVYLPGDDPRNMDWRVTARAGTPHVKLFREERERPVWLLVDQGPSMRFGTRVAFKSVIAARVAALLGWAAVDRGDRVGGLVFDEAGHLERRPAARGAGLLPLLERLAELVEPATGEGDCKLAAAASHLAALVRPGSLIAIVSDFADLDEPDGTWIARLVSGSELLLVLIHDPIEASAPPAGRYPVLMGGRRGILDLTGVGSRTRYQAAFEQRLALLERLARLHGAHWLRLSTVDPVGPALALALGARRRLPAARRVS